VSSIYLFFFDVDFKILCGLKILDFCWVKNLVFCNLKITSSVTKATEKKVLNLFHELVRW